MRKNKKIRPSKSEQTLLDAAKVNDAGPPLVDQRINMDPGCLGGQLTRADMAGTEIDVATSDDPSEI